MAQSGGAFLSVNEIREHQGTKLFVEDDSPGGPIPASTPVSWSGRRECVLKGLRQMCELLSQDEVLWDLGEQCVSCFYDVWRTDCDAHVCSSAREAALSCGDRVQSQLRRKTAWDIDDFKELLGLLRYVDMDGFQVAEDLLVRADEFHTRMCVTCERVGIERSLYGCSRDNLGSLSSEAATDVLNAVMDVDIANFVSGERWPAPCWGLPTLLESLRNHTFTPPPEIRICNGECSWGDKIVQFYDSVYLATHIVYHLCGFTTSERRDAPWLFDFLERAFEFFCHCITLREQGVKGEAMDGLLHIDLDAVAEVVDVFQGLESGRGASESKATQQLLAVSQGWLMSMQREDGSWPFEPRPWEREGYGEPLWYDHLHPTWVGTYALCDRPSHQRTAVADDWIQRLKPLLELSSFNKHVH